MKERVRGVLPRFGQFAVRAIFEPFADPSFHIRKKLGLLEEGENFRMIKVMHSSVGIADQKLLARGGHNDRGCSAWQCLNPQLIFQSRIFDVSSHQVESVVQLLGPCPRFDGARNRAFHFAQVVLVQRAARIISAIAS